MDITSTTAVNTNTTSAATTIKTPEAESETPTRIQPVKPLSFSNGVLKRHQPLHHLLHHHHHHHHGFNNHHAVVVTYKECLKNHAASLGGHAVDGCGEFMPSPTANPNDPTSLKCAACGCHRNFHRREPEEPLPPPNTTPALEYQPHHRHHPPPPHRNSPGHSSPSSPSPPPISSSYYPSAPHMLLALSSGLSAPPADNATPISATANTGSGRKRFRTKFTQDQKEKMLDFAERVGWKMQKRDEELITGFCNEVGLERGVLKVWMHNNKNTLGKKDHNSNIVSTITTTTTTTTNINNGNGNGNGFNTTTGSHYHQHDDNTINNNNNDNDGQGLSQHHLHNSDSVSAAHVVVNTNGSSSSS